MENEVVAITGSAGFVGSHLVKKLSDENYKVIRLDIRNGIDILNEGHLDKVAKFDLLIHLASKTYVPEAFENPWQFLNLNYHITLNALELSRKYNAKFIYISSYIYGQPQYLPVDEKHQVVPHNPYGYSKFIGEQLARCYNETFDMPVIILRPFNLFGHGQDEKFLIPSILKQIKTGRVVLNDPKPKRDLLYIDDFIEALFLIVGVDFNGCNIYNIGFGESYSVEQIVNQIKEITKTNPAIFYKEISRKNEIFNTVADCSKIKKVYGWKPQNTFAEALRKLL